MPYYMLQTTYTSEARSAQTRNPDNIMERANIVAENLGGKIENIFYSLGDYDVLVIAEFPDNVSASAAIVAVSAGWATKEAKITPLMSVEEGIEGMKKSKSAGYRPPMASH